jgi:hypothetical protein
MGKASRTKRDRRATTEPLSRPAPRISRPQRIKNRLKTGWGKFVAVLSFVSIIAGIFAAAIVLPPNVQVERPGQSLEANDPFSSPFYIKNSGYLPIYSVSAVCVFEKNDYGIPGSGAWNNTEDFSREILEIPASQGAFWLCPNKMIQLPYQLQKALLRLNVQFRPSVFAWQHHVHQEFLTSRDSRGEWFWIPLVDTRPITK